MKRSNKNKKIGLALGGGAVLGAAHIGVLRALEEKGIEISCISGTSIGSLIAAFYAFGKTREEIEKIALHLNWLEVSAISLSQFGLLSNRKLGSLLKKTIGNVAFTEASIPLAMITTDISNGEKVIIKEGSVSDAVTASTCIPGIFKPVEISGRLLVDGGIVENVPISPLAGMGAEVIIAVDLIGKHSNKRPDNIIEVMLNSFIFTIMTATKLQTEKADILIKPDLSKYDMVHTSHVAEILEKGYSEAVKVKILNKYF